MKKVIVILILAVFIASIAVVNFAGILPVPKDSQTYVTSIDVPSVELLGENGREIKPTPLGSELLYTFDFIATDGGDEFYGKDDENNPNIVTFAQTLMVFPTNATNKEVEFIIDRPDLAYYHEISKSIIFMQPGVITVNIKALDGHGASLTVTFWARSAEDQVN